MNSLTEIKGFTGLDLDDQKMAYYNSYFHEYYQDRFRPNQGTEIILDLLNRFGKSGVWLDVGAGPATLFWSLMLKNIKEIHCSEINIEGLKVLNDFMESDLIPGCYWDVMNMYNISKSYLQKMRQLPRKYFLFDALNSWPIMLGREAYDIITAFGVFGLCKSAEEYKKGFKYMKPFLKFNGIAIGANWIRSQCFIGQNNTDNRYLKPELVQQAADKYGYDVLHLSNETINGDPNYNGVIVWVLKNK